MESSWLERLKHFVEKIPIVILRFNSDEWGRLRKSRLGVNEFTIARPHELLEGVKSSTPCLILGKGDGENLYFGLISSRSAVTTLESRLPEKQRAVLWSIFDRVRSNPEAQNQITLSTMFSRLAARLTESKHPPFDFAVIDESQDISVAQLKFLAALGGDRPNGLFFAGDLGQRIFQQPFSWKALGVDIRGRSRTLRINYRTSHQIRMQADRLLGPEFQDVDGNVENRWGTISLFNGPEPRIMTLDGPKEEIEAVGQWLKDRILEGVFPHEIGVFVRSDGELDRARAAVDLSGIPYKVLDDRVETSSGHISISTMHLAKGLEFRSVVVMACDDEVIPSQKRIETVADESDLQEVYDTERHLLYVACTRARDHLLVTSAENPSEFLDDLMIRNKRQPNVGE